MCGIVGAVANRQVVKLLIDGLKRLEYRGYDSAGIAVIDTNDKLDRLRVVGKVKDLEQAIAVHPLQANIGIVHTRWATHGVPSEDNAHPFISNNLFALVHNGIIENHMVLREKLTKEGYQFASQTDTEVVVHLIHHHSKAKDTLSAVYAAVSELEGAYAFAIFSLEDPTRIIGVRKGAPLVVGLGHDENFIASDPLALLSITQEFIYLEDNDIVDITAKKVTIYSEGQPIKREKHTLSINADITERGEHRHFMQKEIMEQPGAFNACLEGRTTSQHVLTSSFGPTAEALFPKVEHVHFVACGTSYHAALVAKYWLESLAEIPCSVEVASEYRYRDIAPIKNSLFVALSQSGETADTLAALRLAKKLSYLSTITICNAPGSTMTRESGAHFLTHAGVEIGVASTKAFITQLVSLFLLALSLRQEKHHSRDEDAKLIAELRSLPKKMEQVLQTDNAIKSWSHAFTDKNHALFLGRGILYPIALEGALKMKEISYIHAEGYPAGELKHGPLALVDKDMPIIACAPRDHLLEKTLSNLQEVHARGGNLFILTDEAKKIKSDGLVGAHVIEMPSVHPLLTPMLYTLPLQLLAYHVAVLKGTDVDQPRNLAKSVTVE